MNANKGVLERTANTIVNAPRAAVEAVKKTNPVYTVLSIVGAIVFIMLIYRWWTSDKETYASKKNPILIGSPVKAHEFKKSRGFRIRNPTEGLEFSYSFWMYIADWRYKFGQVKNILVKGDPQGSGGARRAPGIWLYPKTNALHARISTTADENEGCDIQNLPLQKWVHVTYVLNNRTVDIYVNGKLERSCVLRGVPVLNNERLHVLSDGGFFGQLSKLHYFSRALTTDEVYHIYSNGPYMSKRYSLNL